MNKPDDHDLTHILWRLRERDKAFWTGEPWWVLPLCLLWWLPTAAIAIMVYWLCKQLS